MILATGGEGRARLRKALVNCDACRVHFLPGCWAVVWLGMPKEHNHKCPREQGEGTRGFNLILGPGPCSVRGSVRMNTITALGARLTGELQ